ncbi:MAG: hypothetical protein A2845_05360 [Candidatus Lloydbacteria bacterium RIFCSPHIGHO2_01_FULL_49_22]|uniref:NAD kinase n=1 Tax=Candidatus Lloydbacteria bacterium RIFCSPHIGHO2_01_FULL_49_22 TaxID=1798658 RepID=A0A1G2CTZ5_9BACT|nr:MAG: hypothetical protein A2845_05360 [Candidatus Lloydbacteria bacterium RIFCSPHIGHO2_01_FULL_49_22]OGZ09149.1 MAG: hypothetical protein A3C14_04155 [Candidatus Lloydbacteria bacterium RIFCSPHIGHO2_02_FULL_50_18]
MKTRVALFCRADNRRALNWKKKIIAHIAAHHPRVLIVTEKPNFVITLGGDGTILESARYFQKNAPIFLGLNLGHVGFLASARRPDQFIGAVDALLSGSFVTTHRMMLTAKVFRGGALVHTTDCLNEVTAQGIMGTIRMTISVDGHPLQYVHGSGVIIATPTGSTAYNLSAHGPIVTPDMHCMIVTELLDHNIPTPSLVLKNTKTVYIDITEVRKRGILAITQTNEPIDAVLTADDMDLFPLHEKDRVEVTKSKHIITFAEFEDNYFLKSLQKKFAFR